MHEEFTVFVQQLFNGTSLGMTYALLAIGITLVYGLTGLANFAHGELLMLGALITVGLVLDDGMSFYMAMAIAVVAMVILSVVLERTMFRPTLKTPITGFIVSLGLVLILQGAAIEIWGPYTRSIPAPVPGVTEIAGVRLSNQRLFLMGVTLIILAALYLFLNRTKYGIAMRALAEDRETATWIGIPVSRMIVLTFVIGGGLAAIGGALVASLFPVHPFLGQSFVLKGFAASILGGLGNVAGAAIAGIVIGMTEAVVAGYFFSEWRDGFAFGIMVVILLFRPSGIFRGTEGAAIR